MMHLTTSRLLLPAVALGLSLTGCAVSSFDDLFGPLQDAGARGGAGGTSAGGASGRADDAETRDEAAVDSNRIEPPEAAAQDGRAGAAAQGGAPSRPHAASRGAGARGYP